MNAIRKITKSTFAIVAETLAALPNPNNAATIEIMRKIIAYSSIELIVNDLSDDLISYSVSGSTSSAVSRSASALSSLAASVAFSIDSAASSTAVSTSIRMTSERSSPVLLNAVHPIISAAIETTIAITESAVESPFV